MRTPQNRNAKIVVCLVERNALAASFLREILACDPTIGILSEYSTLSDPAGLTAFNFVIDIDTLGQSVFGYLRTLKFHFPDVKTLLLSKDQSISDVRRLLFLGVQGYVSYGDVRDQIVPAIHAISNGKRWFAPGMFEGFLVHRGTLDRGMYPEKEGKEIFTPREKLVIGLVQRRLSNKEIASALRISESTAKFHLSNIFRKLGVRDRHSVVEVADSDEGGH